MRIESNGGDVTIIGLTGTFTGHTGGGEITLERAKGLARLRTGGGDIRVSDSELDGTVSTGGGMVRLSGIKGDLRGSSGSGPVIYGENEKGEKYDLRSVNVEKDKVRVTVKEERRSKEEERTKEERVRVKDELIKIDPPNFRGRFVLETAYTMGHEKTRIRGDWKLEIQETDEWDSRYGRRGSSFGPRGRWGAGAG